MNNPQSIQVWDLSVRFFHWSLVIAMGFLWYSGEINTDLMQWHSYAGYGVLGLIIYRFLWGWVGSYHARFSTFVRPPNDVIDYTQALLKGQQAHYISHNPLGGWMVITLMVLLAIQGISGLFTSDDIFTEGPLVHLLSSEYVTVLSRIHRLNINIIIGAIGFHLIGVFFHSIVKKEPLIQAMITGKKPMPYHSTQHSELALGRALLTLSATLAILWGAINLL